MLALLEVFSSLQVDPTLHGTKLDLFAALYRIKTSDILDRGDIDIAEQKIDALYKSIRVNETSQEQKIKDMYDAIVHKVSSVIKLPSYVFSKEHRFILLKQDTYARKSQEELREISACISSVLLKCFHKTFKNSEYGWLYDFLMDIKSIVQKQIALYIAEENIEKKIQQKQAFSSSYASKATSSSVHSQLFDKLPDNPVEA